MMSLPEALTAEAIAAIAVRAGAVIDRYYHGNCKISEKADHSLVTEADQAAETMILAELRVLAPELPVIAEEEAAAGRIPVPGCIFALVDPLDGTKEFIAHTGEFTVNIAIVVDGTPVLGAVYAPAISRLWVGGPAGAWTASVAPGLELPTSRMPIAVRAPPAAGLTIMASRSHGSPETEAYIARFPIAARMNAGSSIKFCRVAEGSADLYPRFGRTMEWDTAAGHGVVLAAGGRVVTLDGAPLKYGKTWRGYDNPNFVVVSTDAILQ